VSGLARPNFTVEYSSDASSWTEVSDDVIEAQIKLRDITLGDSSFSVKLNNKNGQYDSVFPTKPTEQGLNYYWRFKINGKVIGIFRSEELKSSFAGDELTVEGYSLGKELINKKVPAKHYGLQKADDLLESVLSDTGITDVSFSSSSSAARTVYVAPSTGKQSVQEAIQEISERIQYSAYVDSTSKPATLLFHAKDDSNYRLNTVLKFNLASSSNNVLGGSLPRSITEVYNYLTLPGNMTFAQIIPADRDAWTETEDGWSASSGEYYLVSSRVRGDSGDIDPPTSIGSRCEKGKSTMSQGRFYIELDLTATEFGSVFPCADWNATYLTFYGMFRNSEAGIDNKVKFHLIDSSGNDIWQEYSCGGAGSDFEHELWTSISLPLNTATGWNGDTGSFDWDNLKKFAFEDSSAGTPITTFPPEFYVDNLRIEMGTGSANYLSDSDSISKYGQRELELKLPAGWVWFNLYDWVEDKLNLLKEPARIITLKCLIDPAEVTEYGGSTPKDFFPSYLVQLEADRWDIPKWEDDNDNGTWWRILSVEWNWSSSEFYCEVKVAPSGQEGASSENYSYISGERFRLTESPLWGYVSSITRRIKGLMNDVQSLKEGSVSYTIPEIEVTGDYFFLPGNNYAEGTNTFAQPTHFKDNGVDYDLVLTVNSSTPFTADRTWTIDLDDGDRTLKMQGDLTVESNSIINQDLSSDASPTFAGLTLTDILSFSSGLVQPVTDDDVDLGDSTHEFKDVYVDGVVYADEIQLESTEKIQFRDSDVYINSGADGRLDLNADDYLSLNSESVWMPVYGSDYGNVLCLPFEEGTGTAVYDQFDGDNDYVTFGEILDMGTNDWTLSAWFKTSTTGVQQGIISKRTSGATEQGYRVFIGSDDKVKAELNDGTHSTFSVLQTSSAGTFQDGQWHHVAVTFDRNGYMKLYIDGNSEDQTDISATDGYDIDTTRPLLVGASGNGTVFNFDGVIDEARIFNRVLSSTEIQDLYEGKDVGGGRVLCLRLDEGEGSTVYSDNWCDGKFGKALSFDGEDYVEVSDDPSLDLSLPFTLCAWAKRTADFTESSVVFRHWTNYGFYGDSSEKLRANYYDGTAWRSAITTTGWAFPLNTWVYVAVKYEANGTDTDITFYVNGEQEGDTVTLTGQPTFTSYPLWIGMGNPSSGVEGWIGCIDEIRIYNRALTPEEIRTCNCQL